MSAGPFCQRKFTFTLLGRPACYLSRPPIFSPMTELGLKRRVQKGEIGRSLKWVQFSSFGPSIFTDRSFSQTVHFQSFGPSSLMYHFQLFGPFSLTPVDSPLLTKTVRFRLDPNDRLLRPILMILIQLSRFCLIFIWESIVCSDMASPSELITSKIWKMFGKI